MRWSDVSVLEAFPGRLAIFKHPGDLCAAILVCATFAPTEGTPQSNEKIHKAAPFCSIEVGIGGMEECATYLSEAMPESFALFCRPRPGYPDFSRPGACWSLPTSLCVTMDAAPIGPWRYCLTDQEESDPTAGTPDYLGYSIARRSAVIVGAANWVSSLDGVPPSDLEDARLDLSDDLDRVVREYHLDATDFADLPDDVRLDLAKTSMGTFESFSCGGSVRHHQFDEIVAGRVTSGSKENINDFCLGAASCGLDSLLGRRSEPNVLEDVKNSSAAFDSLLCTSKDLQDDIIDVFDREAGFDEISSQLSEAATIMTVLKQNPQALTEDEVSDLTARAEAAAAAVIVDPNILQSALYALLLAHYGVTLGDLSAGVASARQAAQ